MACEVCGKTAWRDGVIETRVNELGVEGIWRCEEHLAPEQRASRDPETYELCRIIVWSLGHSF